MSNLGNKDIMAKNIKHYMESRGVDRNKICSDLNLKYTTFTDWVNAKTYPRIDKIEMLANYFGITKADLVEDFSSSNNDTQLTKRDERDIQKRLKAILEDMDNDGMAMFNGDAEMDEETRELLRVSIENSVRLAKIRAKEKFTPKKYKK
ncbi:helix-turn-helix domain-containing protein [uncultured Megasphaera sp.]|uniref:helix-turn-helix domain-containing protein n=1 Tax=uncultured Megasphaera sp. TaxID=165188 RepID=UPI002053989A|nr:helix-turn-helix domain-containing protein [uncultured Megasphaera sp.]DAQ39053.1 MAG TPA: Repressor protein CI [Caudoviricetes sp.]